MTADEARKLADSAASDKESEVGKCVETILLHVNDAACKAKRNVTIEEPCKGFNTDQMQALRKSLESLGYRIAWNTGYQGSYLNISW